MKKLFSTWTPLLIFAVIITITVLQMIDPHTTIGYELTTTPKWMIWTGCGVLVAGSIVLVLISKDLISTGSWGTDFALAIAVAAATFILAFLFFINFQYDWNNPYA